MVNAPAPTVDNAGCCTEQVGKWREKQSLQIVPGFLVNLQLHVVCFKCHLFERDCATYLLLLQDPLFLQCQPGYERTKAPPPPGSSAPPSPETGQTRALLPDFVSPEAQTWSAVAPLQLYMADPLWNYSHQPQFWFMLRLVSAKPLTGSTINCWNILIYTQWICVKIKRFELDECN